MSTVPLPAGETAEIMVSESTVNEIAGVLPKSTCVAPEKLTPFISSDVPPRDVPDDIESESTDGRVEVVAEISHPPTPPSKLFAHVDCTANDPVASEMS